MRPLNIFQYFTTLLALLSSTIIAHSQLPKNTKQVVIGIAPNHNSSHVTLSLFEKNTSGWQQNGAAWKGRLGRNGLAWGLGLHPAKLPGIKKKEGDKRSPSGIFRIGSQVGFAFGYAPTINKKSNLPYKQITSKDLWVEDSSSPYYNRHLLISHQPKSTWEKKAQMHQKDYAHALKLFIAHNEATPTKRATPNAGSAIFFHIWRGGGTKSTAGCTTMKADQLQTMISKIDPDKNPVYILLTSDDYKKYRTAWKLP